MDHLHVFPIPVVCKLVVLLELIPIEVTGPIHPVTFKLVDVRTYISELKHIKKSSWTFLMKTEIKDSEKGLVVNVSFRIKMPPVSSTRDLCSVIPTLKFYFSKNV